MKHARNMTVITPRWRKRALPAVAGARGVRDPLRVPLLIGALLLLAPALTLAQAPAPAPAPPAGPRAGEAAVPAGQPAAVAAGQPGAPSVKVERGAGGKKVYRITEAIRIEGKIQKPEAFYVLQKSSIDYDWEELRQEFVPKIVDSVSKAPF
jgi:hypothetical protein